MNRPRLALLLAPLVAVAIVLPVVAASPSPSVTPPGQEKDKPAKPDKADKGPEIATTVRGPVVATTDGQGRPSFTLTAAGKTWELSAGPKWFWGDKNPLAAYVGKTVTVVGTTHAGSSDLSVDTVDGTAIRAEGKPPWAGGPRVVGERHPGWKDWKADGKPGKGHGRDDAPGQTKDKTAGE